MCATIKEKELQAEAEQMHNGAESGAEVRPSWLLNINGLMQGINYINFSVLASLPF